MLRAKKISIRQIRRYLKNREGTAAIEFAILAIPFFMLLFAILELAIVFFINSTLTHSVSEASRQIRTGNFQACGRARLRQHARSRKCQCPRYCPGFILSQISFAAAINPSGKHKR